MLDEIYYYNENVGKGFRKEFSAYYDKYHWMTNLLGDPTLKINPPYLLNREVKYLC